MRLAGKEILSKQTHWTSRSLLSFSVAVILIEVQEVNISTLKILEVDLRPQEILIFFAVILVGMFVSHLVSWFGDFLSLREWVVGSENTEVQIFFGGRTPLASKLQLYLEDWENFKSAQNGETEKDEDFASLCERAERLTDETVRLRSSIVAFKSFAFFQIFAWYLLVPVCASLFAFKLLLFP